MIIKRNKPIVYLMVGCPGSGKSTWIKNNIPGLPIVSRDLIREELGYCKSGEKIKGSKEQETNITKVEYEKINTLLNHRESFVVDDTNVNNVFLDKLISLLRQKDIYLVAVKMSTPLNICIQRRKGQVPREIVTDFWNKSKTVDLSSVDEIIES